MKIVKKTAVILGGLFSVSMFFYIIMTLFVSILSTTMVEYVDSKNEYSLPVKNKNGEISTIIHFLYNDYYNKSLQPFQGGLMMTLSRETKEKIKLSDFSYVIRAEDGATVPCYEIVVDDKYQFDGDRSIVDEIGDFDWSEIKMIYVDPKERRLSFEYSIEYSINGKKNSVKNSILLERKEDRMFIK